MLLLASGFLANACIPEPVIFPKMEKPKRKEAMATIAARIYLKESTGARKTD